MTRAARHLLMTENAPNFLSIEVGYLQLVRCILVSYNQTLEC